jgi:TPR repeat protein
VARDPGNGRWRYQLANALLFARRESATGSAAKPGPDTELPQTFGPRERSAADAISEAARLNYPKGEWLQARRYFENADRKAGHEQLEKLRRHNISLALELEALNARDGLDGAPDEDAALRKFEDAINAGDPYVFGAAFILQERGDWRRYFEKLALGAARGDPYAILDLGYWSEYGKSEGAKVWRAPDLLEATRLFEESAAKGDPDGLHNFANILWFGAGIKKDVPRACNLMWQSAYLGNSLAMYHLAMMLSAKDCPIFGLTQWTLYQHAADAGNIDAMLAIGDAYKEGRPGLPADAAKAIRYYYRVTESGEATDFQKTRARAKIAEIQKRR